MKSKEDFEVGKVYFECAYLSDKRPVPEIFSWVFIGVNIYKEDQEEKDKYYYFQDPETYFEPYINEWLSQSGTKEIEEVDTPHKMRVSENDVEGLIYDLNELKEFVLELDKDPYAKEIYKMA